MIQAATIALMSIGATHPFVTLTGDPSLLAEFEGYRKHIETTPAEAPYQAPLRAIEGGWVCDHCGYTQLHHRM
jgi:hypothetical protein